MKFTWHDIILAFAVAIILAFCLMRCEGSAGGGDHPEEARVDTLYLPSPPVHDTVYVTKTEAAGTVTARLEAVADVPQPPLPETDSVAVPQGRDSVDVLVPLTTTTFEGENYTAKVTGFHTSLDDIVIRTPPAMVVTKPVRENDSRVDVTIGPQLGYGFTPNGWSAYAGIGVTLGIKFGIKSRK